MKASVLQGPGRSDVLERPRPVPGDDEVLVRVSACGVCASEARTWHTGGEGRILGHEVVGAIAELGSRAPGPPVGTRVTGLIMAGFAEYAVARHDHVVEVPQGLDDAEALGEPLSCMVSGAERTTVRLGDSVAVVGVGYMGLGFLQLLALRGPREILAVDTRAEALDHARRFGATAVCGPGAVPPTLPVTEWAHIGRGVDVAVEATGTQAGLDLAGDLVAAHGILSIVGYHQGGPRRVNMELWNWKGITVVNAHERRAEVSLRCMKAGLALVRARRIDLSGLVTHEFGLDGVDAAYEALAHKPPGFIKAMVRIA